MTRKMKRRKKVTADEAYRIYEEKYIRTKRIIEKAGGSVKYDILPKEAFEVEFGLEREEWGRGLSVSRWAVEMAKRDAYPSSYKQGKSIYNALLREGFTNEDIGSERGFSIKYQKGSSDFGEGIEDAISTLFSDIEEFRVREFAKGKTKKEVSILVSQQFFGSR